MHSVDVRRPAWNASAVIASLLHQLFCLATPSVDDVVVLKILFDNTWLLDDGANDAMWYIQTRITMSVDLQKKVDGILPSYHSFLSPSLGSRPLNPAMGPGGPLKKSSPAGSGAKPQSKLNLVHLCLKIWHLVATILIIFMTINWLI